MPLSWFNDCHTALRAVEMKSSKQVGEEIKALQDRVTSIQSVATQDQRELLEDEQAEIDAILGTPEKPGQIEALSKDRERLIRIESLVSNSVRQSNDNRDSVGGRVVVPARARATGVLKAFKGPTAQEDAYKSGQFILATVYKDAKAKQWCLDHGV